MTERHGGLQLPPGRVHIRYTPPHVFDGYQQPHVQQVAVFDAERNDHCPNGALLDFSPNFVVYAVKNGLVRILQRKSTRKHLLRAHEGKQVTDIKFFRGGDVLGTVGRNLLISRIFERGNDIVAESLLEFPETIPSMTRMIWHPFNPNQFWIIHCDRDNINVATLVTSTKLKTIIEQSGNHPLCECLSDDVMLEGAIQLATDSNLIDLEWYQPNPRLVLTAHEDGSIKLWECREDATVSPRGVIPGLCKFTVQENGPISRCFFLPHHDVASNYGSSRSISTSTFCTSSQGNSCITIWSPFSESEPPSKLQVFQVEGVNPNYNIGLIHGQSFGKRSEGPTPVFILLSDRTGGNLYALALKAIWGSDKRVNALVEGFDYLIPFSTKYPTYSWCVGVLPTNDFEEETNWRSINFDIRFYALQSKMVQDMRIPHYMLSSPNTLWEAGSSELHVDILPSLDLVETVDVYEEEYDVDVMDEEDDEDYNAPDPASLPTPDYVGMSIGGDNPFANWLGNLAAKAPVTTPPEPRKSESAPSIPKPSLPPGLFAPPGVVDSLPGESPGLLSPSTIFSSGNNDPVGKDDQRQQVIKKTKAQRAISPKGKGIEKKNKGLAPGPVSSLDGKITILKKDRDIAPEVAVDKVDESPLSPEESMKKSIASHFKAQEKIIIAEVQRVVRHEVQLVLMPELSNVVTTTVQQSVKPLKTSLERMMKDSEDVKPNTIVQAVAKSVEEPLKQAFTECMVSMMIPAFEAATKEMFSQVGAVLENISIPQKSDDELNAKIDALTAMVQSLASEVSSFKDGNGSFSQQSQSRKQKATADPIQIVRAEILDLLSNRNYDAAFTKAVSATTAEIAVFVCKNADLGEVLGGNKPALTQPILLCLMQQLGAALLTSNVDDLNVELMWLQEIALTLNSSDQSIARHVPPVLTQLVTSIEARMQQGDPNLRRPLQMLLQVIRGMQR